MSFTLPKPAWQPLDVICRSWKAQKSDVLKYAAEGLLQLHAFVTPYGEARFLHEGRSEAWVPTTPVIIPPEIAARLIHESFVELSSWSTKDGERWECSFGHARRNLQVSSSNLVLFRDEQIRFENKHAESEVKDALAEAPASEAAPPDNPTEPAAEIDASVIDTTAMKRREQQILVIEELGKILGYDIQNIPTGGKRRLMELCRFARVDLFGASEHPFEGAWKEARRQGRVKTVGHDDYAGK
jgi:hypothetical protein